MIFICRIIYISHSKFMYMCTLFQMTSLMVTTLAPIAISLALLCLYLRDYYTSNGDSFEAIKLKYLNYFFYLTYLVLPSVSTIIFQTFVCTNIDPNNEDDDLEDRFLTVDMSISCSGTYYTDWLIYASIMIVSLVA